MKKILAILLAMIMVLGMTACGTETETTTTETETTKTEIKTEETKTEEIKTEETETAEPEEEAWPMLKASALCFTSTGFAPRAESAGVDYYREKYGLDLEVLPVDISTSESWNIFWAGGGYADIILPYGGAEARQIVAEGICRTIEYDWIKEYMPRMHTLLIKLYGTDEEILKNLNINGETWCIPYFAVATGWNTAFRNDWLEAVGLEVPTTIEEYTEVLRAFTEDDPDGNGMDDTYGCTSLVYGIYNVAAAFGTADCLSYWKNADETAITTNANAEEYRNYLRQVGEWYQAGYMDPESITDNGDRASCRSKFANGTVGSYSDNPWWWETTRGEVGPLQMLCETQGLDFQTAVSFSTALESTITGEPIINAGYAWINGQASIYFGHETSDEVVIRMMNIIDEAVMIYNWDEADIAAMYEYATRSSGIEGTNWEVNEETGAIVSLKSLSAEEQNELGAYLFPVAANVNLKQYEGREDEFCIELRRDGTILNRIYRSYNCTLPTLDGEVGDKAANVTDYFNECRWKFITGEMDIDADWDAYCETLEEYGLSEILAAYEAYFGM